MPSTHCDLQALSARLDKLETQARRWKLASIFLALSSALLILMGARFADHIDSSIIRARSVEAEDFILKDQDGQVHARLSLRPHSKKFGQSFSASPAGTASSLEFYDQNGEVIWTAPQSPTMVPTK
jgi:hypothetical protein